MNLLLVTGDARLAGAAYDAGVDRVFVDLEQRGKAERQAGRGLFLSTHTLDDVERIRSAVPEIVLMVRVNPFDEGTAGEIRRVIGCGADVVMLPMADQLGHVAEAAGMTAGVARLSVLIETVGGVEALPQIVRVRGLDEVHLGLNDLAISMGKATLFDPLCDGTVDSMAEVVRSAGLPFGFGGVTAPGDHALPVDPDLIIAEHVRLQSHAALLGRSFRVLCERGEAVTSMKAAVSAIRHAEQAWFARSSAELLAAHAEVVRQVGRWREYGRPRPSSPSLPTAQQVPLS